MKKNIKLLALLLAFTAQLFAQETKAPNYTSIEKEIQDKNSQYYYPSLEARYTATDTTLTLEQLRHLYYGNIFFKKKLSSEEANEVLSKFNEVLTKPSPTKDDFELALKYSAELLQYKPYSILLKRLRVYCFAELGRTDEAITERAQYEMIIEAILSSGTGADKNNQIHVIDSENEHEILTMLRFEAASETVSLSPVSDYIALKDNPYKRTGVYFYTYIPKQELSGL